MAKGAYVVKGGMHDELEACLAGGMHGKGRHAFKRDCH